MAQKYNLRSGKKETVLPVQLQVCDDQDFMSQMLGASQPTPAQRQVHSDLSSGSYFEFSDLVQSSDSEADASGSESRSYKNSLVKIKFRMKRILVILKKL